MYSAAYNSFPEFEVRLSAEQYELKTRILTKIYGSETNRFLNVLPATFVEPAAPAVPKPPPPPPAVPTALVPPTPAAFAAPGPEAASVALPSMRPSICMWCVATSASARVPVTVSVTPAETLMS